MAEPKRIFRSARNKVIGGVCGGLAEYFGVDPVLLRLAAVALLLAGSPVAAIGYIIAWIIIPESEEKRAAQQTAEGDPSDPTASDSETPARESDRGRMMLGYLLVFVGAVLLLGRLLPRIGFRFPWIGLGQFWPLVIVLVGIVILMGRRTG